MGSFNSNRVDENENRQCLAAYKASQRILPLIAAAKAAKSNASFGFPVSQKSNVQNVPFC